MADWLAFGQAVLDAGGWAVVVALVTGFLVSLWKGWLVFGKWHWPVVKENEDLRAALLKATIALARRDRPSRRPDA